MAIPPRRRPFLTADWCHLVMINYAIDPDLLSPHVPRGTSVDLWNGQCLVSVVGFLFNRLSLFGRIPVPWLASFEEVNLRFYVVRRVGGETRRGVVFVKELAPSRSVTWIANHCFHENYQCVPMRHAIRWNAPASKAEGGSFAYQWRTEGRWSTLHATTDGPLTALEPRSLEAFITEHYWGYSRRADGATLEYQVDHAPWNVWQVRTCRLDIDAEALYGPSYADCLSAQPHSALVAEGSPVALFPGVVVDS